MSYEVEAWVCLNGGADVEMKVTVPEDATEEQIDEAVKQAAMNHLDWGWFFPVEESYDDITDTDPCGCCMCCSGEFDWEYDEDEDWEDE
jgi:hypothetical protein